MSKYDWSNYEKEKKEFDAMTPEEQEEYLGDDWDVGALAGPPLDDKDLTAHGGEGSGNFDHAGRPGKVGGSKSRTGTKTEGKYYGGKDTGAERLKLDSDTVEEKLHQGTGWAHYHLNKTDFSEDVYQIDNYGHAVLKIFPMLTEPGIGVKRLGDGKIWIAKDPDDVVDIAIKALTEHTKLK